MSGGRDKRVFAWWGCTAFVVVAFAAILTWLSGHFGYAADVLDMPVVTLVILLCVAGAAFCVAVPALIATSSQLAPSQTRILVGSIFIFGLVARLILLASEPALEDDYQRYLWDGGLTAHAISPYGVVPGEVLAGRAPAPILQLGRSAGPVLERVNHPDVSTIYPPVAQAAFALAHLVKPYSLNAWRSVLIVCDVVTFFLLIAGLDRLSRARLWVALYWWNPVVLKELFNSSHLEPLIFPCLVGALLLAHARRPAWAAGALGIAAGIKLWPALLLPLIIRPLVGQPRQLVLSLAIFGALLALAIAPMIAVGLDDRAGLVAYASNWRVNAPVFAVLDAAVSTAAQLLSFTNEVVVARLSRALVACFVLTIALMLSWRATDSFDDLVHRALIAVVALIVFAPAVYPWYTLWLLPLVVLRPEPGLIAITATIPLFYLYFYFAAREQLDVFKNVVVWMIWLPPLAVAFISARWSRLTARPVLSAEV